MTGPAMQYGVRHVTVYDYAAPVLVSHHAARLEPREGPRQQLLSTRLTIEPPPPAIERGTDYFGNPVAFFTVPEPHRRLTVTADSIVAVSAPPPVADGDTAPWEEVGAHMRSHGAAIEAVEFALDSPFATASAAVRDFARGSFAPGRPVLAAARDLCRRIHDEFAYDREATGLGTPLSELLHLRRGVCQDFAHLGIAALRAMGLAARYVGGYLLTTPPPGQPRLQGADASHAWLSVWVPDAGWVDLDPTNDMLVAGEHVTCAWGRDYGDVSPIKGVVLGGGAHSLTVAVDMVPQA